MSMIGVYLIASSLFLVLYQIFASRLEAAAQPLRLRLACEGEGLLQNPDLSAEAKDCVEFLLSTTFGMRSFLLVCIVLVPFMSLVALVYPKAISGIGLVSLSEDPNTAIRFRNLCRLHDTITVANNPILRMITAVEMALLLTPALTIRSSIDGVLSPGPGVETMVVAVGEMVLKRRGQFAGIGSPC